MPYIHVVVKSTSNGLPVMLSEDVYLKTLTLATYAFTFDNPADATRPAVFVKSLWGGRHAWTFPAYGSTGAVNSNLLCLPLRQTECSTIEHPLWDTGLHMQKIPTATTFTVTDDEGVAITAAGAWRLDLFYDFTVQDLE